MSITYGIKLSQTGLGDCNSNVLWVDNSYASTGIGIAKFISLKADGTSNHPDFAGYTVPTWKLADASSLKPAQGIVYVTSARANGTDMVTQVTVKDPNFYPTSII